MRTADRQLDARHHLHRPLKGRNATAKTERSPEAGRFSYNLLSSISKRSHWTMPFTRPPEADNDTVARACGMAHLIGNRSGTNLPDRFAARGVRCRRTPDVGRQTTPLVRCHAMTI